MGARLGILAWLAVSLTLACGPSAAAPPRPAEGRAEQPAARVAAPPAAAQKLTVAIVSPSESMAIPWVAKDTGIFAKHGFDVEVLLVSGTPRLVQSLIAGDFDYALVGVTALVRAGLQGFDPVILAATSNYSSQSVFVHPQANVRTMGDLRGKTVGISQYGSEADTFLQIALSQAGMRPEELSLLQTGGHPQTATAMLTGNLDAGVLGGANGVTAERGGMIRLADARQLNVKSPNGTLATTRRHIDRDRAAVLRFMRAYVEGVHYFKTQPQETIAILQHYLGGLPTEDVAVLYEEVRNQFQPLPAPSEESMQAVLAREPEAVERGVKPSDLLDLSFLRELEQSGFVAGLYQ